MGAIRTKGRLLLKWLLIDKILYGNSVGQVIGIGHTWFQLMFLCIIDADAYQPYIFSTINISF